jgi:hypothetical protein
MQRMTRPNLGPFWDRPWDPKTESQTSPAPGVLPDSPEAEAQEEPMADVGALVQEVSTSDYGSQVQTVRPVTREPETIGLGIWRGEP